MAPADIRYDGMFFLVGDQCSDILNMVKKSADLSIKVLTKSLSKRFKDGFKKDGCQVPVLKPAVSASFLEVNAWSFCSLRRRPKTSTN